MRWKIVISFCILCLLIIVLFMVESINNYNVNLYSWKYQDIDTKEQINIIRNYSINNLFQDFNDEFFKDSDDQYFKKLHSMGVNVYHLTGDSSWGTDKSLIRIKEEIDKVVSFNNKYQYKIKGIVFDIEPYISERVSKFSSEDFKIYVDIIKETYKLMKDNNLELIICIPYWFDKIDINLLEELIINTDGIEVMNYDCHNTKENIKEEIFLATKYNKKISSIYEIDFSDKDKFSSYDGIDSDFKDMLNYYDYNKFDMSYHHYSKMKD